MERFLGFKPDFLVLNQIAEFTIFTLGLVLCELLNNKFPMGFFLCALKIRSCTRSECQQQHVPTAARLIEPNAFGVCVTPL